VSRLRTSPVVLALALSCCLAGPAAAFAPRKDAKDLSPTEKQAYVAAVLKLKKTPAPGRKDGLSIYDTFVATHAEVFDLAHGAHSGPAFLPWHRAFLHAFETALRKVSGDDSIAIPYWDWTDPASTMALFSNDLMGGTGDPKHRHAVVTGPFRKGRWRLPTEPAIVGAGPGGRHETVQSPFLPKPSGTAPIVQSGPSAQIPYLQRDLGGAAEAGVAHLPTAAQMADVLAVDQYDSRPWSDSSDARFSFRCGLEGWSRPRAPDSIGAHNAVHVWVGGAFEDHGELVTGTIASAASPNDPVFWSIHANVDRLWTQWEAREGFAYDAGSSAGAHQHLKDKLALLKKLGHDIGDPELAAGTLRPEDLLDPAPWEAPYQEPLAPA